jgi:hypothetical protein
MRRTAVSIVYVLQPGAAPGPSGALSASEAKNAAIDFILKRLNLQPA